MSFPLEKFGKIVLVILVLLVLSWILFFPGKGGFSKVKDFTKGITQHVGIGAEKVYAKEYLLPEEIQKSIDNLVEVIKKGVNSQSKNCLIKHPELPLEKMEDERIILQIEKEKLIIKTLGGKQVYKIIELPRFQPCLIYEKEIPKNFYHNFLKGKCLEGCQRFENQPPEGWIESKVQNWFCPKAECLLPYFGYHFFFEISEEKIKINEEEMDYNDGSNGWLFKADEGTLCFFPTRDGGSSCDGGKGLLDDDCFTDKKPTHQDTFYFRTELAKERIPFCS